MKKNITLTLLAMFCYLVSLAQVGIGTTTPNANAVLDIVSTTQGMLFPRMTTAQRDAIASPVKGLTIFNTDLNSIQTNIGTSALANWIKWSLNPSSNGTAVVSGYTCNTASAGTMTAGVAVSGVTQTITATVTTMGSYSISTTANGVTFAASGTFASTGAQNIVLTATGTPTTAGSNTFTLNTTPNCNFSRTAISVPGAPTNPVGTPANEQASVAFTAPVSNGGSAITSYTVTSSPGARTATGASSPLVVTGLTNGTSYTFKVVATNAVGNSVASVASNGVSPRTVPDAPTNISVANASCQQVRVSFTAPVSNGGSAITSYTVTSTSGTHTVTGASSPLVVTGLNSLTFYRFNVKATNAAGTSGASLNSSNIQPNSCTSGGPK